MTKTFKPAQPFTDGPRPQIALVPVESNQVRAIGYDAATKTLAVTFKRGNGAIYHYPGVEPATHAEFVNAESVGRYFGLHIEPLPFAKYPAETAEAES
ncbi:MAG: hypothetical protein SHS37scaffold220_16 [Phage 67_12]|nr:MAG: hypothetical protein SHS37scaffold220_16 [Phage 67_12]